jgi:hypothetical protein
MLLECKHRCQIIHLGQDLSLCRPGCLCCDTYLLDVSSETRDSNSMQRIGTYADLHDIISQNTIVFIDVTYVIYCLIFC